MAMNVLHVVCHDLGKHMGCYGALVDTPNLDQLALEGMRFDRAFCSSPACSPSRMCAMTGRYAHVSGGLGLTHMGWPLPEHQRTIVDDANDAGVETAHFGLSHERHPQRNHYRIDQERTWSDWRIIWTIIWTGTLLSGQAPYYYYLDRHLIRTLPIPMGRRWRVSVSGRYGRPPEAGSLAF